MSDRSAIVVGTRASALAMAQTAEIVAELRRRFPRLHVELRTLTTLGDRDRKTPLASMGSHGVFTSELERALLAGTIDLAVHSFKDLPTDPVDGLVVAAVPRRADPFDALILRQASSLRDLPPGASVAAGSPRRREALRCVRPDLDFLPVRGNIDTRLSKLAELQFDALVMARAALDRLGRPERTESLQSVMLPAPAQGALALQTRADDTSTRDIASVLHDPASGRDTAAERSVLKLLGGGCHLPLGVLARTDGSGRTMTLRAQVYLDARVHDFTVDGPATEGASLAARLADNIQKGFPNGLSGG